jgi:hypothetical protein
VIPGTLVSGTLGSCGLLRLQTRPLNPSGCKTEPTRDLVSNLCLLTTFLLLFTLCCVHAAAALPDVFCCVTCCSHAEASRGRPPRFSSPPAGAFASPGAAILHPAASFPVALGVSRRS